MAMLGFLEIIIIIVVLGLIVIIFSRPKKQNSSGGFWSNLFAKPALLNCWHCGKPTPAEKPECEHCGKELK